MIFAWTQGPQGGYQFRNPWALVWTGEGIIGGGPVAGAQFTITKRRVIRRG